MRCELTKAGFAFFVDLGTFNLKRFGCIFGGDLRAAVDPFHAIACGPANSIAQNQPDIFIIIDRIGLVAGTKVKDFAVAAFPSAAGAENFTALEPGDEVFRSGCTWKRGNGKIFYFGPGHEAYPIYYHQTVRLVLRNAVKWAAPDPGKWIDSCPQIPADKAPQPLEIKGPRIHKEGEAGFR